MIVQEISLNGGRAVASYDSVENGENIITTAIKHFGKVDILINNAGILRDRSFNKLSFQDREHVFNVHVNGAFKCTRDAWPYMSEQKYGRIIMTSSASSLYGNFGQSNYSAAKLALLGFANTLVLEGKKANIHVNTVAPVAETAMSKGIFDESGYLKPDHVSPIVLYLCHESCKENGSIIETGGGFTTKVRLQRSQGYQLRKCLDSEITLENVAENWNSITDFSKSFVLKSSQESVMNIMKSIQNLPTVKSTDIVDRLKNHYFDDSMLSYSAADSIRYALSVGCSLPDDRHFLYENSASFSILSSYLTTVGLNSIISELKEYKKDKQLKIDFSKALHGEQYIELYKPLPSHTTVRTTTKLLDILDKRKFCQLIFENEMFNKTGEKIGRMQNVLIFMGSGRVGRRGKCEALIPSVVIPRRVPDAISEEQTSSNQAALFRLNGDFNPLHIDPDFSSTMDYDRPILHGLCSYGFALRHVLKTYANNDSTLFKAMKAQFSKPVFPGNTLVTEMWKEGGRIIFQTKVKESGNIVLKGGFVELNL